MPALREALLNAMVHRSYTNPNDIQIKIFDDSITVFSPGTFYGGISVADIQTDNYKSSLRNKLIAEAFYLTSNIEKYGSGFIRIRKALRDYLEVSLEVKEIGAGRVDFQADCHPWRATTRRRIGSNCGRKFGRKFGRNF
ncbi:MAG: hypothetical protein EPO43_06205 [Rugosibacter sp.]|nr:MAG: hypothetical protein EPO43_06205 [Rugosibacter sp.]